MLAVRFGVESVFKDVDDIEPGDDFVDRITGAVAACDVLLALIGTQWLTMTDDRGRRRLDNPEDFVRLEITAALSREVRVVPILVDGAKMPTADQLPEELVPLTRRQAVEINPIGFNTDRLLATLAATFAAPRAASPTAEVPGAGQVIPELSPEQPVEPERPAEVTEEQPAPVVAEPPAPVVAEPPAAIVEEQPPVVVPEPPVVIPEQPPVVEQQPDFAYQPASVPDEQPVARSDAPGPPSSPPSAATPPPPPPPQRPAARRPMMAIAAGVVVVLLVGALLVLRPWAGGSLTAGAGSTPTDSLGPSTPSVSGTPDPGGDGPLILAHRGGLEEHQFETQQAMEAAAAAGFSVETDVRYTSDGVAVLVHDEKATKGLDCDGRSINVSKTTWADLNKYCTSKPTAKDPAQYHVPRLDNTLEGIAAASDQVLVFLEIKTEQTAAQREAFLTAPAAFGLRDRTVITSFNREWLEAIRKADSATKRMLFVSGDQVPADGLRNLNLWAVGVEQSVATKEYVDELKAIGVQVMIWVLNDPKQWTTFVPFDPDIVMTAYPAKLKAWLASR